jgi:hypothetical protein
VNMRDMAGLRAGRAASPLMSVWYVACPEGQFDIKL